MTDEEMRELKDTIAEGVEQWRKNKEKSGPLEPLESMWERVERASVPEKYRGNPELVEAYLAGKAEGERFLPHFPTYPTYPTFPHYPDPWTPPHIVWTRDRTTTC